jgi:hypothetical protein
MNKSMEREGKRIRNTVKEEKESYHCWASHLHRVLVVV